jgi:hypothetical protein
MGWSLNAVSLCGARSQSRLVCVPIPIGRLAVGAGPELIDGVENAGDRLAWFVTVELLG